MLRPSYKLTQDIGTNEGDKVLRLLMLWVERGIITSQESDEMRTIVTAKELPGEVKPASQGAPPPKPGGMLSQIRGLQPGYGQANMMGGMPRPVGLQVGHRPPLAPGQQNPMNRGYRGQKDLQAPPGQVQTPETVPVGVMATMLKQVSARFKSLNMSFKAYRPMDPAFTPQLLPAMDNLNDRLLSRCEDFYQDLREDL